MLGTGPSALCMLGQVSGVTLLPAPPPQDGSSLSLCSETLTVIMVDVSVPWVLSVDVIRLWILSHQTLGLV